MEKKDELLPKLATIVDLIEKIELNPNSTMMVFDLPENEYISTFSYINKKYNGKLTAPGKTFTINISGVDIIFNRSSVEKVQTS
jgi:hypothetical protein